uniref:Uncharacterized protein n=1 Tax=Arundo donax TaxID=35708 RepID=A0A0A9EVA1_ARUDO
MATQPCITWNNCPKIAHRGVT